VVVVCLCVACCVLGMPLIVTSRLAFAQALGSTPKSLMQSTMRWRMQQNIPVSMAFGTLVGKHSNDGNRQRHPSSLLSSSSSSSSGFLMQSGLGMSPVIARSYAKKADAGAEKKAKGPAFKKGGAKTTKKSAPKTRKEKNVDEASSKFGNRAENSLQDEGEVLQDAMWSPGEGDSGYFDSTSAQNLRTFPNKELFKIVQDKYVFISHYNTVPPFQPRSQTWSKLFQRSKELFVETEALVHQEQYVDAESRLVPIVEHFTRFFSILRPDLNLKTRLETYELIHNLHNTTVPTPESLAALKGEANASSSTSSSSVSQKSVTELFEDHIDETIENERNLLSTWKDEVSLSDFARALSCLAYCNHSLGKLDLASTFYAKTVTVLEQSINAIKEKSSSTSPASPLSSSSSSLAPADERPKTAKQLKEDLATEEAMLGQTLSNWGHLCGSELSDPEKIQKGVELALRGLSYLKDISGENSEMVAATLSNLSSMYGALSQLEEAYSHGIKALEIFEKTLGFTNDYTVSTLKNVRMVLTDMGASGADRLAVLDRQWSERVPTSSEHFATTPSVSFTEEQIEKIAQQWEQRLNSTSVQGLDPEGIYLAPDVLQQQFEMFKEALAANGQDISPASLAAVEEQLNLIKLNFEKGQERKPCNNEAIKKQALGDLIPHFDNPLIFEDLHLTDEQLGLRRKTSEEENDEDEDDEVDEDEEEEEENDEEEVEEEEEETTKA